MTLDLSSVACSKRGEVWWYVSLGTRHSGGGGLGIVHPTHITQCRQTMYTMLAPEPTAMAGPNETWWGVGTQPGISKAPHVHAGVQG